MPLAHHLSPSDYIKYNPPSVHLQHRDVPIRAQSVCLQERPRSQYGRSVKSADLSQKQFHPPSRPQSTQSDGDRKRRVSYRKPSHVLVKSNRKSPAIKVPFTVSVQNLSIPMKYADNFTNHPKYSTSNRSQLCTAGNIRSKSGHVSKQVSDKKLCEEAHRKETENKLLLQISEAEQIVDFERILNSNAILSELARGHVWRRTRLAPSTADARPRSSYSLHAVSEAYHYLFRQHHDSLRPLIDSYRQGNELGLDPSASDRGAPHSILGRNWYDELQDLSEFYDEDKTLQEEIDVITDQIITDDVNKAAEDTDRCASNKNFNLNLSSLISLHVTGDSLVPLSDRDESGPSSEIEQVFSDQVTNDGKEWLAPIMSSNADEPRQESQDKHNVDGLAQDFSSASLQDNTSVPAITLSNCCEGCSRTDEPNNTSLSIHLTVPTIQSINESRPPIMR